MARKFFTGLRVHDSITLSDSIAIKWDTNNILSHNGTQTYLGDSTSASVLTLNGGNASFSGNIQATSYIQSDNNFLAKGDIKFRNNADTSWNGGQIGTDANDALRFAVRTSSSSNVQALSIAYNTLAATFSGDILLSHTGSAGQIIRTTDNNEPYFALQRNSGSNGVGVLRLMDGGDLKFDTGATGAGQSTRLTIDGSNGKATFAGDVDVTRSSTGEILSRIWNSNTGGGGTAVMRIANSGNQVNGARLEFSDNNYYNATVSVDRTNGMRFMVHDNSTSMSDLLTHTALTLATNKNATFTGNVILGTADSLYLNGTTGVRMLHDGSNALFINQTAGDIKIHNQVSDKDIIFRGKDGASTIDALTLDMSEGGAATFAGNVTVPALVATADIYLNDGYSTSNRYLHLRKNVANDGGIVMSSKSGSNNATNDWQIVNQGTARDLSFYAYGLAGNALTLDRETGNAIFAGSITTNLSSEGTYFTGGSGGVRQLSITSGTNTSAHALHTFNIASSNGKYEFDVNGTTELSLDSASADFVGVIKVGPGTTGAPYDATTFLHVRGTTRSIVQQSSTADAYYMFGDAAANNVAWVGYNHSNGNLNLQSETSITLNKTTNVVGDFSVSGNLTVSGTTTTLNTQTVEVEDNILQLNTTQGSPDTATATTSGISVYRGNGITQASLIFDEADDTWDLTNNLKIAGNIAVSGGTLNLSDGTTFDSIINAGSSLTLNFDSDNNSTGEIFRIHCNTTGASDSNKELFKITESGLTNLNVMPTHESEGILRIGRHDTNASRYHDIKSYVSSTQASNYLKFSLHGGTVNAVADVLTLKGDLSATFAGNVALGDGKLLKLGASDDYQIYHNSTTNVNHIFSNLDRQLSLNAGIIQLTNQANNSTYLKLDSTEAIFANKASFNTNQSPAAKIQAGAKTFGGGNGVYADSRLGIMNNGSLTSIVNASTYNDATYPDYGLVFIQGPSTSSYNVWSLSPDGPAKGSDLNLLYQAQATNIHTSAPKVKFHSTGAATFAGSITAAGGHITGNLGVGTAPTSRQLSVFRSTAGSIANFLHYTNSSTFQGLYIQVSQTTNDVIFQSSGTSGGGFKFYSGNAEKAGISATGGISGSTGTFSGQLIVNNGSRLVGGALQVSSDTTYLSNYSYTFRDAVGINNPNSTSAATSSSTVMAIGAKSGGTLDTSLITTGAVGIGIAAPTSKLHVNGTVFVDGGMASFETTLTNNDDWQNSPVSILERDNIAGGGNGADKYSPNLNFHWRSRVSNSLWMNASGHLHYGSYGSSGIPTTDGIFKAGYFYGDGSNLTGITSTSSDPTKLPLAGGTLTGDLIITSAGTGGGPCLRINNLSHTTFNHGIEVYNANLVAGESEIILVGKAGSTKNSGYIGYNWAANASNNNYVTIGQYGANHIFRVYGDQVLSTVTLRSQSDVRGTLFYDIDDTTYYLNPNSTGTSLRAAGTVHASLSNMSAYQLNGTYVMDSSRNLVNIAGITSTSNATLGNSTTDKVAIAGNLGLGDLTHPKIAYPGKAASWDGSGGTTGQIVIDLPGTLAQYDMLYIEIDVYEYSGDSASKIIIGGHNWNSGGNSNTSSTQWHNAGVQVIGSLSKSIYLGRRNDGSNERRCIAIGETTSTWSYGTVHVSKVHGACYYTDTIDLLGDWNVDQTTSTSYFTKNPTTNFNTAGARTLRTPGFLLAGGSVRAPIFYDSNNTGYFLDPQNKSTLHSLKLDGIISGTTTGCAEYGRNHAYHTPEIKGYGAEFMIGAQHTSININYRTCNNGASGHTPTDWYWRAGSATSFANMYMAQMSSSTNARAPIFYDSNNTSYYLDPHSTGTSLKVAGDVNTSTVTAGGNITAGGNVQHAGLTMTTGTDIDQIKEFTMSFQLAANTWTDTGIDGTDLATGTYIMQVYVDDYGVNGGHYTEYYSATISWFSTNTNDAHVDEIIIHRAGHAPQNGDIQFRTERTLNADSHDLMLQVKHNLAYNAALDNSAGKSMRFKFRSLI